VKRRKGEEEEEEKKGKDKGRRMVNLC